MDEHLTTLTDVLTKREIAWLMFHSLWAVVWVPHTDVFISELERLALKAVTEGRVSAEAIGRSLIYEIVDPNGGYYVLPLGSTAEDALEFRDRLSHGEG